MELLRKIDEFYIYLYVSSLGIHIHMWYYHYYLGLSILVFVTLNDGLRLYKRTEPFKNAGQKYGTQKNVKNVLCKNKYRQRIRNYAMNNFNLFCYFQT